MRTDILAVPHHLLHFLFVLWVWRQQARFLLAAHDVFTEISRCPISVRGAAHYQMKDKRMWRAQSKSIGINLLVSLPPVPLAQKELRSMQMCVADKDLKRGDAVDAALLSTRTQLQLRLDVRSDLEARRRDGFAHRRVVDCVWILFLHPSGA